MNESGTGLRVHTLGTGGGPIVSASRAGTSTLIDVDGAGYLIDCGMGSIRNYRDASTWSALRAIFLTHHHSDHLYDLGAYLVTGWEVPGESFAQPVDVYGPHRADRIPAPDEASATEYAARAGDRRPNGTTDIVNFLLDGVFGNDICIRMADEGRGDPRRWIRPHDIELPLGLADPVRQRHPEMEPVVVHRDDRVTVTAILVDHRLCYPAYAYRFDTEYGSVVISGDTAPSRNCIRLAQGADLLLHEVIDLDAMLASLPPGPTRAGIETHLRESHTPHDEVGQVAADAGVGMLVLHHIVPNTPDATDPDRLMTAAAKQFSGTVRVAEDGDVFAVSAMAVAR